MYTLFAGFMQAQRGHAGGLKNIDTPGPQTICKSIMNFKEGFKEYFVGDGLPLLLLQPSHIWGNR